MRDDPHLMRVRRQLEIFQEGPPEGWMEAMQAHVEATQMAAQAAAFNAPTPGLEAMPTEVDPGLAGPQLPEIPPPPPGPFSDRLPIDIEPMPAKIRHRQLSKQMAAQRFASYPKPWQDTLLLEHREMANAAGIVTVPAMQQAQANGTAPGQQPTAGAPGQAGAGAAQMGMPGAPGMPMANPIDPATGAPLNPVQAPEMGREIAINRNERGEIVSAKIVPPGTQAFFQQQQPEMMQ
jgi:hypothetical protein